MPAGSGLQPTGDDTGNRDDKDDACTPGKKACG
jgi:hypothetical protein